MLQKAVYSVVMGDMKNKRGERMLEVKAVLNDRSVRIPTNIYVLKYQFKDEEIVEHPQAKGLNAMIGKYIMELQEIELEAFRKDIEITAPMLYTMYVDKITASTPLVEFNRHVMATCTNRRKVTRTRYTEVVKLINDYHPGVCLEDIDLVWLKKFEKYTLNTGVSDTTVWARMKVLRMLFNEAIKRDLLKPNMNPFKMYVIPEMRSRNDVLMFQEVEELELYGFKNSTDRITRDLFCLACYTGLRCKDLLSLTSENITSSGGVTWLKVKTSKTGAFVQIPISVIFFGNAMRILEKYSCIEELNRYACNSSINRNIKRIIDEVGVGGSQRITLHTARRSFITGLADFGVPIHTIQKLAGHARISTTSKYLQLSTGMILNDLEKAFCDDCSNRIVHIEIPPRQVLRVSPTGRKLVIGSDFLACKNCSFFERRICRLFHKAKTNNDWCDSFSERFEGEPEHRVEV